MATTETLNASDAANPKMTTELWSRGKSRGGAYAQKRVNQFDKVGSDDINQLRDSIELLAAHSHNYTDAVGGC